jgi:glyoxylase-like metal-dependent hydrolase (beta-lactamase superfamily II)
MAAESASGIPLELIGLVAPLPADGGPVPGQIVEHQAHAIGHAAVLLADRGVLLAGDMLSDVLIPLLDPRRPDQVGAYETARRCPGHGEKADRSTDLRARGARRSRSRMPTSDSMRHDRSQDKLY